ncbi:hypothetical protein GGQ57_003658 [Parabacteroides faecis]|uniref:DUF4258 domain-containing protein n=1 Tax=Parabacteroides faecis TaxID=1217282 RepID=A0ABR6KS64_9BACT|nr:hypothetical protein [Parabacteroides faecis]
MNKEGDHGISVFVYVEDASIKIVKIITIWE